MECLAAFAILLCASTSMLVASEEGFVSPAGSSARVALIPRPRDVFHSLDSPLLMQWITEYKSLGSFTSRNLFAFRCSRYHDVWLQRMSYLTFDQATRPEDHVALAHLTSAFLARADGENQAVRCLREGEPWVVAGLLRLLRNARELKADGTDCSWPVNSRPLESVLPSHIADVLDRHPELSIEVAQTLEAYGISAKSQSPRLFPMLLSNEADIAGAAQSALRLTDPDISTRILGLNGSPLTPMQRERVQDYLANHGDGTIEDRAVGKDDFSERMAVIKRYCRFQKRRSTNPVVDLHSDELIARAFCSQRLDGDWWRFLSLAYFSPEFLEPESHDLLVLIASELYSLPESRAQLLKVLRDDDPRVVECAMFLACQLRDSVPGRSTRYEGGMVDPDVIPESFAKVIEKHPHLLVSVAWSLRCYKRHSAPYAGRLVPFLLSEDSYVVTAISSALTHIDRSLAEQLGVVEDEFSLFQEHTLKMRVLSPEQKELVRDYLAHNP